jgi:hypothetical protein
MPITEQRVPKKRAEGRCLIRRHGGGSHSPKCPIRPRKTGENRSSQEKL